MTPDEKNLFKKSINQLNHFCQVIINKKKIIKIFQNFGHKLKHSEKYSERLKSKKIIFFFQKYSFIYRFANQVSVFTLSNENG